MLANGSGQALMALLQSPAARHDPYARLRALDRLLASGVRDPRLLDGWMQSMLLSNRPLRVWALTRDWPEDARIDARSQLIAAQVAQAAGRRDEARRRYRGLLERHPDWVDAWQKYIEMERHGDSPLARPAVLDAMLAAAPTPYDGEKAAFALAACIERDSPAESFRLAARGHALKRLRLGPWDRRPLEVSLRRDAAHRAVDADGPPREVFVVGLPRSGTTLLASVLGAHRAIANVGEQNLLAALAAQHAETDVDLIPKAADRATAWYRAAVGDIAADATVVVDKLPGNAERCGLALALMPRALVVHIERDIDDCAMSIHQRDFEFGCAWGSQGDELGHYAGAVLAHLAAWRSRAPSRFLHVRFEDLVGAPERTLAPVLAALGLDWDPDMLGFWRHTTPTATYSEAQVQSPLDRRGVGSAARFRPEADAFLRSVRESMAAAADA